MDSLKVIEVFFEKILYRLIQFLRELLHIFSSTLYFKNALDFYKNLFSTTFMNFFRNSSSSDSSRNFSKDSDLSFFFFRNIFIYKGLLKKTLQGFSDTSKIASEFSRILQKFEISLKNVFLKCFIDSFKNFYRNIFTKTSKVFFGSSLQNFFQESFKTCLQMLFSFRYYLKICS